MPAYEAVPRPPKTPALAAFLAFLFPGMGHLYSWAYERAFMIWATIAVCIFLIIQGHWPFSFVIAFVYFFSIFDAYREAQFFNLRAAEEEIPQQRSDSQGRLMFGVFLAVVAVVVLADKLNLFDMEWVYDWWPVPVLALGVYLIVAAIKDQRQELSTVLAGLATECEVQIADAIGVVEPISVMIDTGGTGVVADEDLVKIATRVFDLRPRSIIETLKLRRPVFRNTAAYGHFGREEEGFTWELTDRVEDLKKSV